MSKVFTNGPGDRGSILGCVIPKTQKKWYLIHPCVTLRIIGYVSRVNWSNPGKGVAPFSASMCSSYWKGSLWVALNYSHQLYSFPKGHWMKYLFFITYERFQEYFDMMVSKWKLLEMVWFLCLMAYQPS